jgi:NAD-dependent deacetylase
VQDIQDIDVRELDQARELLSSARRILILTGAGVSAESGVPTFRGPDGLWKTHKPETLATPEAFQADPRLVWEWYGWRRERVGACRPNSAHEAIAHLTLRNEDARLVTQNVDGLHELALEEAVSQWDFPVEPEESAARAALIRAAPIRLHGSLFRTRCTGCDVRISDRHPVEAKSMDSLPRCEKCSALLRPDVVWFGEGLDPEILRQAMESAESAEVCLVVGTSGLVHPAASLPLLTRESGGVVVEVNPESTPLTAVAVTSIRGRAGQVLPLLLGAEPGR